MERTIAPCLIRADDDRGLITSFPGSSRTLPSERECSGRGGALGEDLRNEIAGAESRIACAHRFPRHRKHFTRKNRAKIISNKPSIMTESDNLLPNHPLTSAHNALFPPSNNHSPTGTQEDWPRLRSKELLLVICGRQRKVGWTDCGF